MRNRQSGMSLVELLVAVAIGLIGILIITQAYIAGEAFNRSTLGEGGAQTNGLIGLYTVERDARMAGYGFNNATALDCGNMYWFYNGTYSIKAGGTLPDIALAPVNITFDTVTPANPDKVATLASGESERMVSTNISTFDAGNSRISIDGVDAFKVGDVVVMVKSGNCALVRTTAVDTVAQRLTFASSSQNNPGALASFPTYANGDTVVNLGTPAQRIYTIGNGKLRVTDTLLTTGVETPLEIVDGMVDMRALYGKDTNNDNIVDRYDTTTPTNSAEWLQVQAIKIALLARVGNYEKKSAAASECDATTTVPTWSGSTVAGSVIVANPFQAISVASGSQDRCYRYRVFETVIPLRNIIWRST